LKVIAAEDYDDLSRRAAALVFEQVARKPHSVLVFPTGATPLGLFRELVAAVRGRRLNLSAASFVVLDEYAGIPPGDRRSLAAWLQRELLDPIGIVPSQLIGFDPLAPDAATEGQRVEAEIARRGGIDLAILGLGPNGHLGFNEPGTAFGTHSSRVSLSAASITSNAAYWGSEADVPRTGFTLGLGTLLAADQLALIVSGAHKAEILARMLTGPVSIDLPATIVRLHPRSYVLADEAALEHRTEIR
jgi:glucosamine-6-phosphate deaminase